MERDWEVTFTSWTKPSSDTEEQKCANAENMIRDAISKSETLKSRNIKIFAQGSYRNNTNVRQNSDVDICVCCFDTIFSDFSASGGLTMVDVGVTAPAHYPYHQYRNDVEQALKNKFGDKEVARGNKAFDIHANSYHVDADVVACFEERRWLPDKSYLSGTGFNTDNQKHIQNWPNQHYENGVAKNKATGQSYKFTARILKRLKYEMVESKITDADIPSFLIECLVYNTPNECFEFDTYEKIVRAVLIHVYNATLDDKSCSQWTEVSGLKYLFTTNQAWNRQQANGFVLAAWRYIGFE